jgi:tetratricopeptide (TPR) repeat protein
VTKGYAEASRLAQLALEDTNESSARATARQGLAILGPLAERQASPTAEVLSLVARLEILLGEYADAERHLLQALALAKDDTSLILKDIDYVRMKLQSEVLHDNFTRRFEDALADAKDAVLSQPDDAWAHYQLGFVLEGLGRYQEALTAAENAVRLSEGKHAGFHAFLGSVLFDLQQWDQARLSYEKAAQLDRVGDSAPHNIALCLINLHRYREAADWLQEVLRRNPGHEGRIGILSHIEELRRS